MDTRFNIAFKDLQEDLKRAMLNGSDLSVARKECHVLQNKRLCNEYPGIRCAPSGLAFVSDASVVRVASSQCHS